MSGYQRISFEELKQSSLSGCIGESNFTRTHRIDKALDLASSALGSSIVKVTDEFFAAASNMINPLPPIHAPGKFVGKFKIKT